MLEKVLTLSKSLKIFDNLVAHLQDISEAKPDLSPPQFMDKVLNQSSTLSLFLALRRVYLSGVLPDSKPASAKFVDIDVLSETKYLDKANHLVRKQTYLYPRLHSSLTLLIESMSDTLEKGEVTKFKTQIKAVFGTMIESGVFSDSQFDSMKSVTKFKYLHIGFSLVKALLDLVV